MTDFTRYWVPHGVGVAEHPAGLLYRREEVDPVVDALRDRIRGLEARTRGLEARTRGLEARIRALEAALEAAEAGNDLPRPKMRDTSVGWNVAARAPRAKGVSDD